MSNFMNFPDVGMPVTEEVANGEVAAPSAFPLPVVMLIFLVLGYFLLRQLWRE